MKTIRNILIGIFIGIVGISNAAVISRIYTFSDGQVLTAAQLNAEFNNVVNGVNNIDNSNIATSANIDPVKIQSTIAGDGIGRNGSTGVLEVNDDNSTLTISADTIKVKDSGITSTQILNGTILASDLNSATVDETTLENTGTTIRIKDSGVSTNKIADGAVTKNKLSSVLYSISSSSGYFSTSSSSYVDVTNLSVNIVTNGRPVEVYLISDGSSNFCVFGSDFTSASPGTYADGSINIVRDSTSVGTYRVLTTQQSSTSSKHIQVPCSSIVATDFPVAGSHTYKIQLKCSGGTGITSNISYAKLIAREL